IINTNAVEVSIQAVSPQSPLLAASAGADAVMLAAAANAPPKIRLTHAIRRLPWPHSDARDCGEIRAYSGSRAGSDACGKLRPAPLSSPAYEILADGCGDCRRRHGRADARTCFGARRPRRGGRRSHSEGEGAERDVRWPRQRALLLRGAYAEGAWSLGSPRSRCAADPRYSCLRRRSGSQSEPILAAL